MEAAGSYKIFVNLTRQHCHNSEECHLHFNNHETLRSQTIKQFTSVNENVTNSELEIEIVTSHTCTSF